MAPQRGHQTTDSGMTQSGTGDAHTSTADQSGAATLPAVSGHADGHATGLTGRLVSALSGHSAAIGVRSDGRAVAAAVAVGWPSHWPRPDFPEAQTIQATHVWLRREIEAGQGAATVEVPLFGTAAWVALPDSEPAKWAAVFRAASAWYREFIAIPETTARELATERERFEAWAAERDRADYALFRAFCLETADMIERRERRERDAAKAVLPDRFGPELVAAARASFAWLDGPAPDSSAGSVPDRMEVA